MEHRNAGYRAMCLAHFCKVKPCVKFVETLDEAIEAWNRRAGENNENEAGK